MEKMFTALALLIIQEGTGAYDLSVTYENRFPCVVEGSSVMFRCLYGFEEDVIAQTYLGTWYATTLFTQEKLSDLPAYANRTEYVGDHKHNCSLVIHNVRKEDAGYYSFREQKGPIKYLLNEAVHLSVTELEASVSPQNVRSGSHVTLRCLESCRRAPKVVWFKDGRPRAISAFQARAEDSGNYSCAFEGRESDISDPVFLDVQYAPVNVSVEATHSGPLKEGSSVNLTCGSAANPVADNYTWYRVTDSSSMLHVGSGQVMSLPSVETSDTGLYVCRARNGVGEGSSLKVLLLVSGKEINPLILHIGFGVKAVLILLVPLVIIWTWNKATVKTADQPIKGNV